MQPKFTPEEHEKLEKLLQIMQDETKSPGQRRIAMAKYKQIFKRAMSRMQKEEYMIQQASL